MRHFLNNISSSEYFSVNISYIGQLIINKIVDITIIRKYKSGIENLKEKHDIL